MIFKSILTGLVSTVSAAGVVWFGTAPETGGHPHGPDAKIETPRGESPGVQARTLVVEKGEPPKKAQSGEVKDEQPDRRWIDRYINRKDTPRDMDVAEIEVVDDMPEYLKERESEMEGRLNAQQLDAARRDLAAKRAADAAERNAKRAEAKRAEAKRAEAKRVEAERAESEAKSAREEAVGKDVRVTVREDADEGFKMRWKERSDKDDKMVERRVIIRMSDDDDVDIMSIDDESVMDGRDLDELIARMIAKVELPGVAGGSQEQMRAYEKADPVRLLATTEAIDDRNLRDQALYAVSTYALRFDDFDTADEAVSRMGDDNLRDTAMSKVAIRYGEIGEIDTAMEVIGSLENKELQDIIRVQLVEVLTTPLEDRNKRPDY